MQEEIKKIKEQLEIIKNRNKLVEDNKAWETSNTRLFSIALVTYILVVIFFFINDISKPFLNALVPVIGYLLSVQTLPIIKGIWLNKHRK